jgi:hypothetical protein
VFMILWAIFVNTVDNFTKPWLIGFGIARTMSLTTFVVFWRVYCVRIPGSVYRADLIRDHVHVARHGAPPSLISRSQK